MGTSWDELDMDDALQMQGESSDESDFVDLFSEEDDQLSEFSEKLGLKKFNSMKYNMKKVTAGRIVGMVFMGIFISAVLFITVLGLYTNFIRFPAEQERVWEESRRYALENFIDDVNSLEVDLEDSYLMKELPYANGNKDREEFMRYVVASVSYSYKTVNKKNVFGNDLVDRDTGLILTEESWLSEDEEAYVHYIDYSAIEFDKERVKMLIKSSKLTADNVDYRNILADMFCQYIYSIDVEDLPVVSIERVPQMYWNETGYLMLNSEDVYLDKALFSSEDLYNCFERFAEEVAGCLGLRLTVSSEYREWENLSDANKNKTAIPAKYGKYSISHLWCGAYYLVNDYVSGGSTGLVPNLGDGSKEQPASIGTSVITYLIQTDENGAETKYPLRITMKEFGVSQDAIDWFQAKNIQNRGYDVTSEVQYCYYVFEVTNLSGTTLTIEDNTSLCDSNANCSSRTGIIYGLQDSVTLEPEETGIIESWGRSTELNLKYVIWGKDYARREEPVWFRVLAGDLEDLSENKGVYINDTRG